MQSIRVLVTGHCCKLLIGRFFHQLSSHLQKPNQLIPEAKLEVVDEKDHEPLQGGDHVDQQDDGVVLPVVQVARDKVKGPWQTHGNEQPHDEHSCKIVVVGLYNNR